MIAFDVGTLRGSYCAFEYSDILTFTCIDEGTLAYLDEGAVRINLFGSRDDDAEFVEAWRARLVVPPPEGKGDGVVGGDGMGVHDEEDRHTKGVAVEGSASDDDDAPSGEVQAEGPVDAAGQGLPAWMNPNRSSAEADAGGDADRGRGSGCRCAIM